MHFAEEDVRVLLDDATDEEADAAVQPATRARILASVRRAARPSRDLGCRVAS